MQRPVLSVVTPPAPVVSLDQAKAHLRVDAPDDDAMIALYVAAATAAIDGPDGWLGRALGQQSLVLTAPAFPGCGGCDWSSCTPGWTTHHPDEVRLPYPPIQSVTTVSYLDAATGTRIVVDPASYALFDRVLFPLAGQPWPSAACRPDAIRIEFVAGYATSEQVPSDIRAAILLAVGALYANRVDASAAPDLVSKRLLSNHILFA